MLPIFRRGNNAALGQMLYEKVGGQVHGLDRKVGLAVEALSLGKLMAYEFTPLCFVEPFQGRSATTCLGYSLQYLVYTHLHIHREAVSEYEINVFIVAGCASSCRYHHIVHFGSGP